MENMQNTIKSLFYGLVLIVLITSCTKDKVKSDTDKDLYGLAKGNTGFTWFSKSSTLLNKSSGTGHSQPFLRTRYNSIASTKLDSNGKIISGASFPEGSLIVKELYDDTSTLGRYAILYKNSESTDADAKGWVWGYINSDGSIVLEASKKGSSCINCHSQAGNIDYMLMNKYFP